MTEEHEDTEHRGHAARQVLMDMLHELLAEILDDRELTADQERKVEAMNAYLCGALNISNDDPL